MQKSMAATLVAAFLATTANVGDRAFAASLNISPVTLDVAAPQQATTLNLRNMGARPITGQVRVFAWRQEDGVDVLDPTDAVTASPPLVEVRPGVDYTIRVVRNLTAAVAAEETYRLVIDEVPDAAAREGGQVIVALRYSVPVFFVAPEAQSARVSWAIRHAKGKAVLVAHNDGERRIQVIDLAIGGKPIARGLAGYVLGHSDRYWALPGNKAPANRNITALSNKGPISGSARAE